MTNAAEDPYRIWWLLISRCGTPLVNDDAQIVTLDMGYCEVKLQNREIFYSKDGYIIIEVLMIISQLFQSGKAAFCYLRNLGYRRI